MNFPINGIKHWSIAVAILLMAAPLLHAQSNSRRQDQDGDATRERPVQLSELAKENLNRVAAASVEIREVLVKNPGLLVELKRWVAKEAADNGQVVEDGSLKDDAIFDRLDTDVLFRSVATRLLQKYGYLLPTTNPESNLGKEEELILKERARRLVQVEAQEDSQPFSRDRKDENDRVARTSTCDAQTTECQKDNSQQERLPRMRQPELPDAEPTIPQQTPRTLQAEFQDDSGGSHQNSFFPQFEAASDSARIFDEISFLPPSSIPSQTPGSIGEKARRLGSDAEQSAEYVATNARKRETTHSTWPRPKELEHPEDPSPVRMVHSPNPYGDVPSLYEMYVQPAAAQRPAERFGVDLFRNTERRPDVIPMDLPVGPDYVVGTGDTLAVDFWGSASQRLIRLVDREGRIALPEAGPLLVQGKTLADIQSDVQRALRTVFANVSADVSLSRLRTVRIYVVGEVVRPGAYDISSLSTPLNALLAAGGVTSRGSLRVLKHMRGKQVIEEVDAYDLLLHGIRSDLRRLENGDTLLVPPVGPQATIEGMVRRPAVYELVNETTLSEALELAGGILPTAALRHIEVQRLEAHEKRTMLSLDLGSTKDSEELSKAMDGFKIQDGDQIYIFPMAAYNEDAIYLQGHVQRPGRYSYKNGMKVTDLVSSYADLLPEPAPHYAEIVRLNPPDFHPSVESFDISSALSNPATAPVLRPLDTVRIFSRYDFERPPEVAVVGEVRKPGSYRTSGQAHLRDAIFLAGGITPDTSLDSAQLFRSESDGTMRILSVDLKEALAGNPVDNVLLQARDRLLVHKKLERVDAPTVVIKGEVAKPGRYPLTSNMRVGDLVRTAGGLKRSAFADSADLTRFSAGQRAGERLEINLAAAAGDLNENVALRNGDVLAVRQIPQWNDMGASVRVSGEVNHPATYGIHPGEHLSSLLERCNGFTPEASPYGAVLIRQEVRDLEMKSHLELVSRLKTEEGYLKALPDSDADQKQAKLAAIAQTDTALRQLEASAPVGRVVIHLPANLKRLPKTAADIPLRDGDVLYIPKKTNYVVVSGQVFNPTAVSYLPGRSAKWYLSQSGGLTEIADKNGVFVIRADGSVLSSKNNSSFWSGDPMNAVLKPGDSIVVPERAPKLAGRNWAPIMQAAQVASSVALTVAYIHP